MGRAPCCDKSKVKRGPWSPEEDTTLKNYIERYGTGGNWIALPHKAGLKRCGKSCRLRWLNYLRPDIKHGGFTEEEDNIILTLYSNIGSRWSVIATHLQGRTDNDVKNYWNTKLKKKLLGGKTNNLTSNNSMASSTPSSWAFGSKVDDMINSNSVLPYYPMNYDQHNPCQQLPLPHINGHTSVSSSISQQVSTSFSSENNINASWSGNGDRDDGFLMDSGSGFQFPYHDDVLNSFYFQDN